MDIYEHIVPISSCSFRYDVVSLTRNVFPIVASTFRFLSLIWLILSSDDYHVKDKHVGGFVNG